MPDRALAQYYGMGDAIKLLVVPATLNFVADCHSATPIPGIVISAPLRLVEQTTKRA